MKNIEEKEINMDTVVRKQIDISPFSEMTEELKKEYAKVIIGQEDLIELMLCCVIAEGHILLEGVPGIAKTLGARALAKTIKSDFSRIQFTPDLMPSDILGTSIFNMKTSSFEFKKGPIFSNVILIDEINRAPAKTQAALFEVMEEKQISFDSETHIMDQPFIVIATQNPIEQEGTYRLPEAQLDRFLMKLKIDYPSQNEEIEILQRFNGQAATSSLSKIKSILNKNKINKLRKIVNEIFVEGSMIKYITDITAATRTHGKLYLGASPRASLAILNASKVIAIMAGRDFLIPDDIQYVAPFVLNHRLILTADAEMESYTTEKVIEDIIHSLDVPR